MANARAQADGRRAGAARAARKEARKGAQHGGIAASATLQALALGALAFLLYAGTIGYGYVLDDEIATRHNSVVQRGAAGLPDIFGHGYFYGWNGKDYFYRPLALATLALEKDWFGESAAVHHAGNVLLFALSVALLHLFLSRALDPRRSGRPAAGPWPWLVPVAATLLFAVHPIHTEVVANIKSRDELLAFGFGIATLLLLLRHVDSRGAPAWGASVACYFLAALSKETGLAVIALVPLTLWFFRRVPLRRQLVLLAPYALMAAAYLGLRAAFAGETLVESAAGRIINNVLATAPTPGVWLASRVAVLGRYLWLLVVPHPLSYDYSYAQVPLVGPGDTGFVVALLAHLALIGLAARGFARRSVLSYAILFYALMLALVSNLVVPMGTVMGERLVFASSVGFCLAAAWLLARLAQRPALARPAVVALGAVALVYAGMTLARDRDWRDPGSILGSGLRSAPRSARVQNHYGSYLRDQALALPPANPERARGLHRALEYYGRAIEILPVYAEAHYNAGVVAYALEDLPAARRSYHLALASDSAWSDAWLNLGVIQFRSGEIDSARDAWLHVTRLVPRKADAYYRVGGTYIEEAVRRATASDVAGARAANQRALPWLERAYGLDPGFNGLPAAFASVYRALGDSARTREWEARGGGLAGVPGR